MDASSVFKDFISYLKREFPKHVSSDEFDVEKTVKQIEKEFYPHAVLIFQKSDSLFDETRFMFDADLTEIWCADEITDKHKDEIWKHLQSSLVASFMHGDMKDKLSILLDIVKNNLGEEHAGILNVLNDEGSQEKIKKIIDYISETRTIQAVFKIFEQIDFSEINMNFETPEELMRILQNPEHPIIKSTMEKIRNVFHDKVQRGEISQAVIVKEVEEIKSMAILLFGDTVTEMMGLPKKAKGSRPVVNTPQARAQYRRDRLRMKLEEKYKNEKN
jgi:hypothetical protein